jgi:3-methyladenine DNA glycosylase AlkD
VKFRESRGIPEHTASRGHCAMKGESHPIAEEISGRLRKLKGRKTPEIRAMRREFSKRLKTAPAGEVMGIAEKLLSSPGNHHRLVAYELIYHHRPALAQVTARNLERLGRDISTWDQTDMFGIFLAGPAWNQRQVPDGVIHKWARSNDRWWRRAALVATVALNSKSWGGRGDVRRTLQVCRMLESDRDPMVVKALSWALRVLANVEPKAVQRYVTERGPALAALARREVRNKLTTGLKNPHRRRMTARRTAGRRRSRAERGL